MKERINIKLTAMNDNTNGPSQSTLADRDPKTEDLPREPKLSEHDQEITEAPATPVDDRQTKDNQVQE